MDEQTRRLVERVENLIQAKPRGHGSVARGYTSVAEAEADIIGLCAKVRELDTALVERADAAAAWDALAVARLKELNEARETITAMGDEIRRLKEAYERECDKVCELQGSSPWKGD